MVKTCSDGMDPACLKKILHNILLLISMDDLLVWIYRYETDKTIIAEYLFSSFTNCNTNNTIIYLKFYRVALSLILNPVNYQVQLQRVGAMGGFPF